MQRLEGLQYWLNKDVPDLSAEAMDWSPGPHMNSVAVLLAHIEGVLQEVELDEEGAARAVAEKRLRSLRNLDGDVARRRMYAYLARRGYTGDVIARVLKELLP